MCHAESALDAVAVEHEPARDEDRDNDVQCERHDIVGERHIHVYEGRRGRCLNEERDPEAYAMRSGMKQGRTGNRHLPTEQHSIMHGRAIRTANHDLPKSI